MPRYPDSVLVVRTITTGPFMSATSHEEEEEQPVVGMRKCGDCGADIFFTDTGHLRADGKQKTLPVDAQPDDQGRHRVHWETCDNPQQFRRPAVGDRAR